jgi:hypothetical protein
MRPQQNYTLVLPRGKTCTFFREKYLKCVPLCEPDEISQNLQEISKGQAKNCSTGTRARSIRDACAEVFRASVEGRGAASRVSVEDARAAEKRVQKILEALKKTGARDPTTLPLS